MRAKAFFIIGVTFLVMITSTLMRAGIDVSETEIMNDMAREYKNHCANCHGIKGDGVISSEACSSDSKETADQRDKGVQEKKMTKGLSLNRLSQSYLAQKLKELRSRSFESESNHTMMQGNATNIETFEDKFIDEKMAEYLYKTFVKG